jgi:hypothetical protein
VSTHTHSSQKDKPQERPRSAAWRGARARGGRALMLCLASSPGARTLDCLQSAHLDSRPPPRAPSAPCLHPNPPPLAPAPAPRADITSNTYYDWLIDHAWVMLPIQAFVGKMIASLKEFPARQKPATFTIDQVMKKLEAGLPIS